MQKSLKIASWEIIAEGRIPITQSQTPRTQKILISFEDFLFQILRMSGIFQSGIRVAEIIPKISIIAKFTFSRFTN